MHLCAHDLAAASQVCRHWRVVADDADFVCPTYSIIIVQYVTFLQWRGHLALEMRAWTVVDRSCLLNHHLVATDPKQAFARDNLIERQFILTRFQVHLQVATRAETRRHITGDFIAAACHAGLDVPCALPQGGHVRPRTGRRSKWCGHLRCILIRHNILVAGLVRQLMWGEDTPFRMAHMFPGINGFGSGQHGTAVNRSRR